VFRLPDDLPRPALVALLLLLGSIWGLTFSLAKIGAEVGIPAFGYAALVHGAVGAVLLGLAAARRIRIPLDPSTRIYALVAGLASSGIPAMINFTAVRHLPAGLLAVIVTLAPVLTYAFALALRVEKPAARRAAGTAIGLAGALLIVLPRASLPSPDLLPWALFAMMTPVLYAAANLYVARARPAGANSMALAGLTQSAAGVAMLAAAAAAGQVFVPGPPLDAAQTALLVHALGGALAQLLFFEITRVAGPVVLSQVGYVVTLTGLFWGWAIFGERHSAWVWLATAVILAGVVLVTWPGRRPAKPSG
jgi:drug/metabolite transporter (DMT)-like permease